MYSSNVMPTGSVLRMPRLSSEKLVAAVCAQSSVPLGRPPATSPSSARWSWWQRGTPWSRGRRKPPRSPSTGQTRTGTVRRRSPMRTDTQDYNVVRLQQRRNPHSRSLQEALRPSRPPATRREIRFAFFHVGRSFFCLPAGAARKTAGADRSCLDYNKLIFLF